MSWREQAFLCRRETNGNRVHRKAPSFSLDGKEGLTKINKVCPSVRGRVKRTWSIKKSICPRFETAVKGNSMRRARIEGPINHRSLLVDWAPMEIELAEKGSPRSSETWEVGIRCPFARKPIGWWGTNGNRVRWNSLDWKEGLTE